MKKNVYSDYELTLTAGQFLTVQVHGEWFKLTSNSVASELMISIDGQPENKFPVGRTIRLNNENFVTVGLRNPSGASAAIRFVVSNGDIKDDSVTIASGVTVNGVGDVLTSSVKYTAGTSAPGAPAVAAAAGNRQVIIQNHGANPVWFGGSNVDGSNYVGTKIDSGATFIISTSAAIYLRSTGGSSDCSLNVISKA